LKRLRETWHREGATHQVPEGRLADLRPAFLLSGPRGPAPVERGRATHLLLQHVRLDGPLDAASLTRLAAELVERQLMTPEEARAADIEAVARFFVSETGRWFTAAAPRVRREVPFTLGLPVEEVYGQAAAGEAAAPTEGEGETVLVQGIIDALVDEPDGPVIVDFKTDRVAPDEVPARAERYRTQAEVYRRAVEVIWGRKVRSVLFYFLHPGRVFEMK
ncbi:MAG TPA: hypothetical protein DHW14_07155, partial [Clostridiales bacterium]|nr:hypothetical protein [Clostridiales bacterium]